MEASDGVKVKVRFEEPLYRWMRVAVECGGTEFVIDASGMYPSFSDLLSALRNALLTPSGSWEVVWFEEPRETVFRFSKEASGMIHLSVEQDEMRLCADGSYREICLPFWRALRGLQGRYSREEWRERWHWRAPHDDIDKLTDLLRQEGMIA